jgi:hypothetical protein
MTYSLAESRPRHDLLQTCLGGTKLWTVNMAGIRKRSRADGGTYQVRWVLGGGAAGPSKFEATETFTSRSRALAFKAEVEEAGHQWSTNSDGIRWTKGRGYVTPVVEATRPVRGRHPARASRTSGHGARCGRVPGWT